MAAVSGNLSRVQSGARMAEEPPARSKRQQAATTAEEKVALALRALQAAQPFKDWPLDVLQALAAHGRVDTYPRDTYILNRGQVTNALYIVISGIVEISAASIDGGKLIIRYGSSGWVFGLLNLLDGLPMNHYFRAHEPTTTVALPKAALLGALHRSPQLWESVVAEVAQRNRFILQQFAELAFDPLRTRLARAILILAQSYGTPSEAGVEVELRLAKHKLGELLGVSRQSVTKEMKRLGAEGIVAMHYGRISILDLPALSTLARPG